MPDIITPADPAWYTTFPHIIAPMKEEWLAGFLLRCDEANNWENGGTLACLLGSSYYSRLTTGFWRLKGEHLEKLARVLALPLEAVVATTYQAELARLSEGEYQRPQLSSARLLFHICPLCVSEDRMLSRLLCLPGIAHCPRHKVLLVGRCRCGKPLLPSDRHARPFACGNCQLAWERLPVIQADRERVERDETLLAYYQFFLPANSPVIFASALRLIADRRGLARRRTRPRSDGRTPSLQTVVGQLIELGISPDDIEPSGGQPAEHQAREGRRG
jgi:hypothetical protein